MSENPAAPTPRIFTIGTVRITEDASMTALSNEQIRALLQAAYPEVAHATIRERVETTEQGEIRVVDYLSVPGRKG
ncbi:hypothetical protein ANRL4_03782 [Anaerolineae bacterium]|nr:hypothetical protein ANRL4_03782 [Anaerolineae bacterium]